MMMPLLTIALGAVQLIFTFILFLLVTLWYSPSLEKIVHPHQLVFSVHGVTGGTIRDVVLGYMDGTHGVMSWLIPHENVVVSNGRARMVVLRLEGHEWEIKTVNTWNQLF